MSKRFALATTPVSNPVNDALLSELKMTNVDIIRETPLNGPQDNILSKLVDTDKFKNASAHIFMGKPDLGSLFLLYYLVDAAQSGLPHAFSHPGLVDNDTGKAFLKPIILANYGPNGEKPYNEFIARAKQLHQYGLLKEPLESMVHIVDSEEGIRPALAHRKLHKPFAAPPLKDNVQFTQAPARDEEKPSIFLCCSFSTDNEVYIDLSKELGKKLAEEGYNLVTGGGRFPPPKDDKINGMMYNSQKAHYDAGGDVTGVTFKELNPLGNHSGKGTPTFGLTRIVGSKHLAERVEIMSDLSDAVLIAPGGFGTDTEGLAPVVMRQALSALMEGKPMLIINVKDPNRKNDPGAHAPLIKLLESVGLKDGKDFHVIEQPPAKENAATDMANAVIAKLNDMRAKGDIRPHARKLKASREAIEGFASKA